MGCLLVGSVGVRFGGRCSAKGVSLVECISSDSLVTHGCMGM